MMQPSRSAAVEASLKKGAIHKRWADDYRNVETEAFFDEAFTYIANLLEASPNSVVLDAGCGTCAHSIRLANRGFLVHAVDFAEPALAQAKLNVSSRHLAHRISISRADISSLPFEDETFDYLLCWGVLMHVPAVSRVISELIRVLKRGGTIIISENNMYSLQGMIRFALKRLFRVGRSSMKQTPHGIEYWHVSNDFTLLTRQTNIRWLVNEFENDGFVLKTTVGGQFTDWYNGTSSPFLKKLIHDFNSCWFRHVRSPYLAAGNIVILQKGN